MKASRLLSVEEARRGVYIDFEGPRDNPAILGMLYRRDDGSEDFIQFILDEALHPAWVFDAASFPTDVEVAAQVVLQFVEDPDAPRRLFAWSSYEERRFQELLAGTPLVRIAKTIVNARKLAAPWRALHFPDPPGEKPPMGQRNPLSLYLDLIGYQRHVDAEGVQPAAGISAMQKALRSVDRVDHVAPEVAAAWRATLRRNFDDCNGMREVMLRVSRDG